MKIVAISDTHCQVSKVELPDGDTLIHAGDLTYRGSVQEITKELDDLEEKAQNFRNIVVIDGNHDWLGQYNEDLMRKLCGDRKIIYLRDSFEIVDGIKIYGSPWQPEFCNWAFNLPRGAALKAKWDLIPQDTDVLVTHGPPHGILDGVERWNGKSCGWDIEHVGCEELYKKVMSIPTLKLHIFGHIHCGQGDIKVGNTTFINASICTEQYKPTNSPYIVNI